MWRIKFKGSLPMVHILSLFQCCHYKTNESIPMNRCMLFHLWNYSDMLYHNLFKLDIVKTKSIFVDAVCICCGVLKLSETAENFWGNWTFLHSLYFLPCSPQLLENYLIVVTISGCLFLKISKCPLWFSWYDFKSLNLVFFSDPNICPHSNTSTHDSKINELSW